MLQRRPRPRPGHALKKLASPRPCTFQSVDGGRRVCGGSLRPNRRTPLRKGRAPKPSARDAPSAVCDPIDTHSSQSAQPQTEGAPRTPSGDCLNRRRRWPRAGFRAGWAAVSSCAFQQASALETGPPPAGASLRRPPHEGEVDYVPTRAHGAHLPLVGRSAGRQGCRVGEGCRRRCGRLSWRRRCLWFQVGGRPRGRRGSPWGRWGGGRSPWCLRAERFQATPSRHAVRRSCAPG